MIEAYYCHDTVQYLPFFNLTFLYFSCLMVISRKAKIITHFLFNCSDNSKYIYYKKKLLTMKTWSYNCKNNTNLIYLLQLVRQLLIAGKWKHFCGQLCIYIFCVTIFPYLQYMETGTALSHLNAMFHVILSFN